MNLLTKYVLPYAKAHVAAWGAAASLICADLAAGPVSATQYEAAALVGLGLGGAVALTGNRKTDATAVAKVVLADVAPSLPPVVVQDAEAAARVVQDVLPAVPLSAPVAADVAAAIQTVATAIAAPVVPAA